MSKWRKDPPENDEWVLVRHNEWVGIARYQDNEWKGSMDSVTVKFFHRKEFSTCTVISIQEWMPLPRGVDV